MKGKQVFTLILGVVVFTVLVLLSVQEYKMLPAELARVFAAVVLVMILLILVFRDEGVRPAVPPKPSKPRGPSGAGRGITTLPPLEPLSYTPDGEGLVVPDASKAEPGPLPRRSRSPNGGKGTLCRVEGVDGRLRPAAEEIPAPSRTVPVDKGTLAPLLARVAREDDTT